MLGLTPYYFDYTPTIRFAKIHDFYQRNNSTANFVCESRKKTASLKPQSVIRDGVSTISNDRH